MNIDIVLLNPNFDSNFYILLLFMFSLLSIHRIILNPLLVDCFMKEAISIAKAFVR